MATDSRSSSAGQADGTGHAGSGGQGDSSGQRWLARCSLAAAVAAVLVFVVAAGFRSVLLVGLAVLASALILAAVFWFLVNRGPVRWIALCVAVLAPLAATAVFIHDGLLWAVAASFALWVLAVVLAGAALASGEGDAAMPTWPAPRPAKPVLIMNPRSGDGKVAKFGLKEKAEAAGAEVLMLEGPGPVDVAELARDAVQRGADLLGVAGGDGTQALVAGIAAEHGLPFLVISAGTRNHFALDLGLDRDDPATCLTALADGVELHIDLGVINGRTFVNNASFGAYADVVQSPEYRAEKTKTTLAMLPDLLLGRRGERLSVRADALTIDKPQAILISNNPYGSTDLAGMGRRPRLDTGRLGVIGISVASTRQAIALLRRTRQHGLSRATASEVVISSDSPTIPVGVDGEALIMTTPVRCTSAAQRLRVRVPADRPGVPAPRPRMDWVRLRQLAGPARRR